MNPIKDSERVLMNIALATSGSCFDKMTRLENGWLIRTSYGDPSPQFLPVELCEAIGMPLQEGDYIRCETNRSHPFSLSRFVKINSQDGGAWGSHEYLCEKIGSKELCRISNESISVLRFMSKSMLYIGKEKQIYDWAYKAFSPRYNKKADRYKRCGGVDITGNKLTIWSRAHIFTQEKKGKDGITLFAQPRKFVMEWNNKTILKDIIKYLNDNGFVNEYEYAEKEPTSGMGGCFKITKKDVENLISNV